MAAPHGKVAAWMDSWLYGSYDGWVPHFEGHSCNFAEVKVQVKLSRL
jgi:hypothetical protein